MSNGNQVSTAALIAIAAAGGVGATIAGLVSAWVSIRNERRQAQREHINWLKEKKYTAYTTFMAVVTAQRWLRTGNPPTDPRDRKVLDDFESSQDAARLLLDDLWLTEFNKAFDDFVRDTSMNSISEEALAARRRMRGILRTDLAETGTKAARKRSKRRVAALDASLKGERQ